MGLDVTHNAAPTHHPTGADPRVPSPERPLSGPTEVTHQPEDPDDSGLAGLTEKVSESFESSERAEDAHEPLARALDWPDGGGAARSPMNEQSRRALTPRGQPPPGPVEVRASAAGPERTGDGCDTVALAAGYRAAALRATSALSEGLRRRGHDVTQLRCQIRTARRAPTRTAVVLDQLEDLRRRLVEHHVTASLALTTLRDADTGSADPSDDAVRAAVLSTSLLAAILCLGHACRALPGDEIALDNAEASRSIAARFLDLAAQLATAITAATSPGEPRR